MIVGLGSPQGFIRVRTGAVVLEGAGAAGVPVLLLAREGTEGRDVPAGVRVIASLDEIDAS